MATLMPLPYVQFHNDAGTASLAGCKLYSYEAGTTTPKATYTDQGGGTAHPNPVVFDSAGRASVWLGSGAYKLILKTSAGATVWTKDNVIGSELYATVNSIADLRSLNGNQNNLVFVSGYYQAGDGGGSWFYWNSVATATDDGGVIIRPTSAPAAGRWIRIIDQVVNIRHYGAKGDGTDDTAKVTAANTFAVTNNYPLYAPAGYYNLGSTVTITAQFRLDPHAKFDWSGFNPTFQDVIIDEGDDTQHFDCVAADAPVLSQNWCRPEWFGGGLNDDTTDESVAIQSAINSLQDQGTIFFKPKIYRAVGLIMTDKPRKMRGANSNGSTLKLHSNTAHLIEIVNSSEKIGYEFENMHFYYPYGSGVSSYDGMRCTRVALSKWINSQFNGFTNGLHILLNCNTSEIIGCVFGSNNTTGLRFASAGTGSLFRVVGCWFDENLSIGSYCNSAWISYVGCQFQDNSGKHLMLDASSANVLVDGCQFRGGSGGYQTDYAIDIYGDNNTITSCIFDDQHQNNEIIIRSGADGNKLTNLTVPTGWLADGGATNTSISWWDNGRLVVGSGSGDSTNALQVTGKGKFTNTLRALDFVGTGGNANLNGGFMAYMGDVDDYATVGSAFSGGNSNVMSWAHFDVTHTTLKAAALTSSAVLFTLPTTNCILGFQIRPTVQFAGSGITDYKVSIGSSGDSTRYTSQFDVDTSPSNTNFYFCSNHLLENVGTTTAIYIHAASTGANLDQSTSGTVRVSVLLGATK